MTAGPARSAFPGNRLNSILKTVPPETIVRLDYGEKFPIRLAWDLTGGDGIREGTLAEVTAFVAPRETTETTVSGDPEE